MLWSAMWLAITSSLAAAAELDVERRLEAAIHREIVTGDLAGALEEYQAIVQAPDSPRPAVARALYQRAQCFEKQGKRTEAFQAYSAIVRDYRDQSETATRARARLAEWNRSIPGPSNLNFAQGAPGKLPPAWFVPALPKDANQWAQVRRDGCLNKSCAVVLVPENAPARVGNLMQSFSATAYRGKTLRLTAWLKLEAADPEDRAQMWLSVDRANDRKGFLDMGNRPVRSAEWTKCQIQTRVDDDATFITFGVMLIGRGSVWVDNVSMEAVSDREAAAFSRQ
jgi:hypothetical protein